MRISELSRRVGVASETLRVWERRYGLLKPRRTQGNIRLYSGLDETRVRLMTRYLAEAMPAAQAAELVKSARLRVQPGRTARVGDHDAALAARQMGYALEAFDESSAEQALQTLLTEYSPLAVIRDFLMPYLHEVGERWATDQLTIAQEHFVSSFMHSRLLALARGWDRALGPRVLLACAPEEWHTLGLIAFGIALHAHGWKVTYLGPCVPVRMVESAASQVRPELTMIAASVAGRLEPRVTELTELGRRWPLAIAGPATSADLAAAIGCAYAGDDPVTAAALIAAAPAPRDRTGAATPNR
jgi:DNA-binding transcriptional MerR regulator